MKRSSLIILPILLMSMVSTKALAYDIEVNDIYYNWINDKSELSVCSEKGAYSGKMVVIPEFVEYEGKTYTVTEIGQGAFSGCTKLETIKIPKTVISIGGSAFYETAWFKNQPNGVVYAGKVAYKYKGTMPPNTEITLEDGTLGIAAHAFSDCKNLISVNMPNGVIVIGDYSFYKCSNLVSINIPNSVSSMGYAAFSKCSKISSVIVPNSVRTIRQELFYQCTSLSAVSLSNSIVSIETDAFNGCTSLTSLSLSQSLETIGQRAFAACSNLSSLELPNSLKTIEWAAFNGCSKLERLDFPESLTNIGSSAFAGCTSLTSIIIPSTVQDIGQGAFDSLKDVTIDSDAIVSKEYKYGYAFTSLFGNQVTNYILGDNVKSIGNYVFRKCSSMTSITIPNTVTSIGYSAFEECTGLTSIIIPNSVTGIGYGAFNGCTGLTSVSLSNSLTNIGGFRGCTKLSSIVIPNSATTIDESAFTGCTSLKSVEISNSVTSIGGSAFYGCTGLTFIEIPNSVISIGGSAFYGCTGLTSVTISNSVKSIEYSSFSGCTKLEAIILPNLLETLGQGAFQNCTSLKTIAIPGSVKVIGSDAFAGTNIEEVSFLHNKEGMDKLNWGSSAASDFKGSSGTTLKFSDDVKANVVRSYFRYRSDAFCYWMIENPACFEGIDKEGYVEGLFVKVVVDKDESWIPINGELVNNSFKLSGPVNSSILKAVMSPLFNDSKEATLDLTEVNTHSDGSGKKYQISTIGFEAFRGKPITKVMLPETLLELGGSSFRESYLKSVVIPNSLSSIGGTVNKTSDQFRGCKKLKTVVLGKSVESIGEVVFSKCDSLEIVVSLPMTPPTLDESTFRYSKTNETTFEGHPYGIIVHNDALEAYQSAEYWKDLVNFQTFESTPVYLIADTLNLKGSSARILFYPIDEAHNYGEISNGEEFVINGLEPETSTSGMKIDWITKDGNFGTAILNVATSEFSIETKDAKALSTTKARLIASTDEFDDMTHYGFEWKRHNAPEDSPANKVSAPLYNGQIVGTLNKLKDDVYYKYRPFYTSNSGKTYYGEWKTFFTGDADVYFEPEVYTKDAADVTKVSALLAGVWFEGTDDIEEKGFEYWTVSNNKTRAVGSDTKKVIVSGNSNMLTTTLEGLKAGAMYGFRSYAKTALGTTYGEEKTFQTILIGDADGDGKLTNADADAIAKHIMGQTPTGFKKKMADMNEDGKINAVDIVMLINIIK